MISGFGGLELFFQPIASKCIYMTKYILTWKLKNPNTQFQKKNQYFFENLKNSKLDFYF